MNKPDWAGELVKAYTAKQERKSQEDAKFLAEERLKKNFGPKLWNDLRDMVKARVSDFNIALGEELLIWVETDKDHLEVMSGSKPLKGRYEPAIDEIYIHDRAFRIVPSKTGSAELVALDVKLPITVDKIAESTIESFVKAL